jgi:mRNA interferase RelE/StbE
MSYSLRFSQRAVKDLKKLPKEVAMNIISVLERIQIRPHEYALKLVGSKYFRLKVGDYRVILDIKDFELQILVITVRHRRNAYKTNI